MFDAPNVKIYQCFVIYSWQSPEAGLNTSVFILPLPGQILNGLALLEPKQNIINKTWLDGGSFPHTLFYGF